MSDRRGQDKRRKVHAVGQGEEGSNFNRGPNIVRHQAHLSIIEKVLSALNIWHLFKVKMGENDDFRKPKYAAGCYVVIMLFPLLIHRPKTITFSS